MPFNRRQISRELTRIANASVREVLNTIGDSVAPAAFRIGVTGPPGGGKSTLIKIISGAQPATSGQIFIDGVQTEGEVAGDLGAIGVNV